MATHSEVWLKGYPRKNQPYTAEQSSIKCSLLDPNKSNLRGYKALIRVTRKQNQMYHLLELTAEESDSVMSALSPGASTEARSKIALDLFLDLDDKALLSLLTDVLEKRKRMAKQAQTAS